MTPLHQIGIRSSLFLFLFFAVILFPVDKFVFDKIRDEVIIGAPLLTGFVQISDGVFYAADQPEQFHSLALPVELTRNSYYRIKYDVLNIPNEKAVVTTDFFAPDYDNLEQEVSGVFGMGAIGAGQKFIIYSGDAPKGAYFRVFYNGRSGLEIGNIKIARIPTWWVWTKWAIYFLAFAVLLVLISVTVVSKLNSQNEARKERVCDKSNPILEIPLLTAIYLIAVLLRYSFYILIPYWSGDEYAYKSIAAGIWRFGRHGVLSESMVAHSVDLPNLLYPFLIAPAFFLEEKFYFGIRLINSVVINLSIFPIYFIARRFMDHRTTLVVATISVAIPFANIGAFAVTEVLFFPVFLCSVLLVTKAVDSPESIWLSILFGILVGVLLNIRLNALVLLPAYFLALFVVAIRRKQVSHLFRRPKWLFAVFSTGVVYFLLQFFLRGDGIGDLGLYSQMAGKAEQANPFLLNNPMDFSNLMLGHIATLAIPYAFPASLMLAALASGIKGQVVNERLFNFVVVSLVFSAALFFLAIVFTVSVSPIDLGGLGRWHSRYYFYCYPLIIISSVAFLKQQIKVSYPLRVGVAVLVALILAADVYFVFSGLFESPWFGSVADNMDVQWYRSAFSFYWLLVVFTIVNLALWLVGSRYVLGFLVSFFVLSTIVANFGALKYLGVGRSVYQAGVDLAQATESNLSPPCGEFSAQFLNRRPGRFVVVGDSHLAMVSTGFWIPFVPEKSIVFSEQSKTFDRRRYWFVFRLYYC